MKKTTEKTFRVNSEKLAAEILFREGLDKLSIIGMFVQDYYANIPVENTSSVWNHFHETILKTKDAKPVYAKSIHNLLVDFYQKNCRDLLTIKKNVYNFMDQQHDLWDGDRVGEFMDFVMFHTDEFTDIDEFHFDWKIDELVFEEQTEK
jgi:hypothetical protein